jgi:hypothetical protein
MVPVAVRRSLVGLLVFSGVAIDPNEMLRFGGSGRSASSIYTA